MSGFSVCLDYQHPQGNWTVRTLKDGRWDRIAGIYTSAEAALNTVWLTTDERLELPAIATYRQVRELLDRRMGIELDDDASADDAEIVDAQGVSV